VEKPQLTISGYWTVLEPLRDAKTFLLSRLVLLHDKSLALFGVKLELRHGAAGALCEAAREEWAEEIAT
jgi:hypothetical protein